MVGFSLVELLVALTLTLSVLATALAVSVPASSAFHVLPEHTDVQQRMRAAVEAIRGDVQAATSVPLVGGLARHTAAWPAVLPCGWGIDPVSGARQPCARRDVLSVVLADRPLQLVTAGTPADGSSAIVVERPAGCQAASGGCQFRAGDRVLVADGTGAVDAFEVRSASADGSVLEHGGVLSIAYPRGSVVVSSRIRTYYTSEDSASGALQLRRVDGGSDLPVVDHVTAFSVEYFGLPEPPTVSSGPGGETYASYGPAPSRADIEVPARSGPFVENCAFSLVDEQPVSRLAALVAGADGLAEIPLSRLSDGPWCPHASAPDRFDADLFRVRRMRVTLRTQTASAAFRGPDADWFGRPGSGRDAPRLVPGLGARIDIALRSIR